MRDFYRMLMRITAGLRGLQQPPAPRRLQRCPAHTMDTQHDAVVRCLYPTTDHPPTHCSRSGWQWADYRQEQR